MWSVTYRFCYVHLSFFLFFHSVWPIVYVLLMYLTFVCIIFIGFYCVQTSIKLNFITWASNFHSIGSLSMRFTKRTLHCSPKERINSIDLIARVFSHLEVCSTSQKWHFNFLIFTLCPFKRLMNEWYFALW